MAKLAAYNVQDPVAKKLISLLAADIANLRTQLTAAIADNATLRTAFNTAMTKLNADAGVTDTNYAAAGAITASNPTAASLT
jgi:hypothetical protein